MRRSGASEPFIGELKRQVASGGTPEGAFETFDCELAGHHSFQVRSADGMMQVIHFEIPMKNLAEGR